jgi:hypothetical protein
MVGGAQYIWGVSWATWLIAMALGVIAIAALFVAASGWIRKRRSRSTAAAQEAVPTPPSSPAVPPPRSKALVALIVVGVLLAAYGIAQPLILRQLGDKANGNDSDTISVLVTIVALLVAGLGVGIYRIVHDALSASVRKQADRVTKEAERNLAKALATAKLNESYDLWVALEPLLVVPPAPGTWEEERRNNIITAALYASTAAKRWAAEGGGKSEITYNLAFYQACSYKFVEPTKLRLCVDALGVLPTTDADLEALSLEARDTVAWVLMCCNRQGEAGWLQGQTLAKHIFQALRRSSPGAADGMKLRYEMTFHPRVLD